MTRVAGFLFGALMTLGVASTAGCAEPTNTKPIAEFPVAAKWLEKAPAGAGPTIVFADPQAACAASPAEVRLLLINPMKEPVTYDGYRVDSWAEAPPLGEISPLYAREARDPAGAWKPAELGWCGTGADSMEIPPGHVGEFTAQVIAGEVVRVGVRMQRQAAAEATYPIL